MRKILSSYTPVQDMKPAKIESTRIETIRWRLFLMSGFSLVLGLLLFMINGGTGDGKLDYLLFFKPGVLEAIAVLLFGITLLCNTGLIILLRHCSLRQQEEKVQTFRTLFQSVCMYPIAFVLFLFLCFARLEPWETEQHITGTDNHTYYILRSSPLFIGDSSRALARRTSGSIFHYSVKIMFVTQGDALATGLSNPDPEVRRTCRMLLAVLEKQGGKKSQKH